MKSEQTSKLTKSLLRLTGLGNFVDAARELAKSPIEKAHAAAVKSISSFADTLPEHEYRHTPAKDIEAICEALKDAYNTTFADKQQTILESFIFDDPPTLTLLRDSTFLAIPTALVESLSTEATQLLQRLNHIAANQAFDSFFTAISEAERIQIAAAQKCAAIMRQSTPISNHSTAPNITLPEFMREYRKRASTTLTTVPAFYPSRFNSRKLAKMLTFRELDISQALFLNQTELYQNDYHTFGTTDVESVSLAAGQTTIILGNPGSGKTTFARSHTLELLTSGDYAIFGRLERIARNVSCFQVRQIIESCIREACAEVGYEISESTTRNVAAQILIAPPITIVLDGLDEVVANDDYAKSLAIVRTLNDAGFSILLTTRLSGYSKKDHLNSKHYALQPLGIQAIEHFVGDWFKEANNAEKGKQLLSSLQQTRSIDCLSNPLTLGYTCMLAEHNVYPTTSAELFDRFLDHFISGTWRTEENSRSNPFKLANIRAAAVSLAWKMAINREAGRSRWRDTILLNELANTDKRIESLELFTTGLLTPAGLPLEINDSRISLRWLHRRLHENLAAQMLALLTKNQNGDWLEIGWRACLTPAWDEVIGQCFELMDRDTSMRFISLLLHKLETADGFKSEGIDTLIYKAVRSPWEEVRTIAFEHAIRHQNFRVAELLNPFSLVNRSAELSRHVRDQNRQAFLDALVSAMRNLSLSELGNLWYIFADDRSSASDRLPIVNRIALLLRDIHLDTPTCIRNLVDFLIDEPRIYLSTTLNLSQSQIRRLIHEYGIRTRFPSIEDMPPKGYSQFLQLIRGAAQVDLDKMATDFPRLAVVFAYHNLSFSSNPKSALKIAKACFGKRLSFAERTWVGSVLTAANVNWFSSSTFSAYPNSLAVLETEPVSVSDSFENVHAPNSPDFDFTKAALVAASRLSNPTVLDADMLDFLINHLCVHPTPGAFHHLLIVADSPISELVDANRLALALNRCASRSFANELVSLPGPKSWVDALYLIHSASNSSFQHSHWISAPRSEELAWLQTAIDILCDINLPKVTPLYYLDHWEASFDGWGLEDLLSLSTHLRRTFSDLHSFPASLFTQGLSRAFHSLGYLADWLNQLASALPPSS